MRGKSFKVIVDFRKNLCNWPSKFKRILGLDECHRFGIPYRSTEHSPRFSYLWYVGDFHFVLEVF
jgi:hypothetical protein